MLCSRFRLPMLLLLPALLGAAGGVLAADGGAPVGPPGQRENPPPRQLRVFRLVHKDPGEAFSLIQPMLSSWGVVTITGKGKALTVQDDEEHLRAIGEAIRQFDVAPRTYRVQVGFYRAAGGAAARDEKSAPAPAQLRGLGRKLADLLRWSNYDRIDEIVVTGEEGAQLSARMGGEYTVEFQLEGDVHGRGEVRLRNFRVARIRRDEKGNEQLSHVFGTSVNLRLDKPFVLGATRDEQSRSALLIVLNAQAAESP